MKDFVKPSAAIKTWADLVRVYNELSKEPMPRKLGAWLYRADSVTDLRSSLDKVLEGSGRPKKDYGDIENYLIREFNRRFHHFSTWAPPSDDHLQWLAIMQHYGAPTRLLDWTYSFFVAAYFALNRIDYSSKTHAPTKYIFAVRPYPLLASALQAIRKGSKGRKIKPALMGPHPTDPLKQFDTRRSRRKFGSYVLGNLGAFVYPVTPYHLNDRLSAQQGTFMASGDITKTFQENMEAGYRKASGLQILKVEFSQTERRKAIFELGRMNIHQGTLFPGLQGFAESLRNNWSLTKTDYPIDGNPVFAD